MKLKLPQVTLIVVDTLNYGEAISSLNRSIEKVEFGSVKFLTDLKAYNPRFDFEIVKIDKIKSKEEYSLFILKELYKYFDTEFVLIQQHDSWVLDEKIWDDEFLDYDYIGASWLGNEGFNVGNGGFSLRSKKLCEAVSKDDNIVPFHPEDNCICKVYRPYLEDKYGIVFADERVADKFSFELKAPYKPTFGFHGYFNQPYKKTIVIKRTAAMGDVIMVEPVLRYFNFKGYNVVLDTLPQFLMLFVFHWYKVFSIHEISKDVLDNAEHIDLDLAYENTPQQLHLISYFEKADIPESEYKDYITTPKLSLVLPIEQLGKLFPKYCILHIDNRPQPYRNIYGINWKNVIEFLNSKGYVVIQLGRDDTTTITNMKMNTANENFLMYVCAGADLFIGIDSGISHICSAFGIPSIIFFGSVNPNYIHPEKNNKVYIYNDNVCDKPFCWSSVVGGTEGINCYVNKEVPPCTQFNNTQLLNGIHELLDNATGKS